MLIGVAGSREGLGDCAAGYGSLSERSQAASSKQQAAGRQAGWLIMSRLVGASNALNLHEIFDRPRHRRRVQQRMGTARGAGLEAYGIHCPGYMPTSPTPHPPHSWHIRRIVRCVAMPLPCHLPRAVVLSLLPHASCQLPPSPWLSLVPRASCQVPAKRKILAATMQTLWQHGLNSTLFSVFPSFSLPPLHSPPLFLSRSPWHFIMHDSWQFIATTTTARSQG